MVQFFGYIHLLNVEFFGYISELFGKLYGSASGFSCPSGQTFIDLPLTIQTNLWPYN
jgi:hypothetical protein